MAEELIDRTEFITEVSLRLAEILKDPTSISPKDKSSHQLNAEERNKIREDAYDDLVCSINVLSSAAAYSAGFFDILNISQKYGIKYDRQQQQQHTI